MHATFNITTNRFKFYPPPGRLSPEDDKRRKEGNFQWYPGQKCFSAIFSPYAEDFILSFGIEIVEDDTPDDVEARVNRYSQYAANDEQAAAAAEERAANANTARRLRQAQGTAAAKAEEAEYWQRRIAGAVAHAAQKDNPRTICNRIKGLQADQRRHEKHRKLCASWLTLWETMPETTPETVKRLLGNCNILSYDLYSAFTDGNITPEEAKTRAMNAHKYGITNADRWLAHLAKRLEYEPAYLDAVGGTELLNPPKQPRRVAEAPDDGLKKGMQVEAGFGYAGQNKFIGTVLSLGARMVRVSVPASADPYGYYKVKGAQIPRRYVKAV